MKARMLCIKSMFILIGNIGNTAVYIPKCFLCNNHCSRVDIHLHIICLCAYKSLATNIGIEKHKLICSKDLP